MNVRTLAIVATVSLSFLKAAGALADEKSFGATIFLPTAHPVTKYGYIDWLKKIEDESDGTLSPKLYTGSALLAPEDHLSGIRDGIAQVGWISGTYTPSDIPEDNVIFQMSFVYPDYFVGSFAVTEMNMLDGQLQEQWSRNNLVYLSGFSTPPYRLICSSEIKTLDDIRGKKIRSTGGALPKWIESVGAIPVNVASSESYTGLEKGQLDCATNALDDLRSRSYWDVAEHVSMVELGAYWSINAANRDFWNGLTTPQRKILLDTMAETVVDTGIGYLKEVSTIVEQAHSKGVAFHEPSEDLEASLAAQRATTREFTVNMGAEVFGVENSPELVARFEEKAEKWQELLKGVDYTDRDALLELLKDEVYDHVDAETYGVR